MIHGVHHIALHTPGLERMVAFYSGVLGFKATGPVFEWSGNAEIDATIGVPGSAARSIMLHAGNCYIELFEYSAPASRDGAPLRPFDHGYTHLALEVSDIDEEYARLAAAGVEFARPEPLDGGPIKAVYGKDPDGNIIEIQQVAANHHFAFARLNLASP